MLILSPRAVERLESYTPPWPLPKIFRMTKGGKLIEGIFVGETINTPSMLCVEDYLDALNWAKGRRRPQGPDGPRRRQLQGARRLGGEDAVDRLLRRRPGDAVEHLGDAQDRRSRRHRARSRRRRKPSSRPIAARLDKEGVAHDIAFHRDAPPHFRIWAGATIEASDLAALTDGSTGPLRSRRRR